MQAVWSTPERKNSHGVALLCLADRTERPSSSLYSSCRHHRNSGVPVLFGAYKPRQHLVHPRTAYTPSTVDVAFATIELALLERARLAPPRESCPLWRWRRSHPLLYWATSCRRGMGHPPVGNSWVYDAETTTLLPRVGYVAAGH